MTETNDTGSLREADRLYADLRVRILNLELEPGSVLDEARIVQETGVSRTPVREAIIRLVSEGLLRRDGRQVVVPYFKVGQLRPFFEGLQLMTRATHRMAADRRDEAQLAAIGEAKRRFEAAAACGDPVAMNDANYEFHLAIGRSADSVFLLEAYDVFLVRSLWLARQCFASGADPEYTSEEHVGLTVRDHSELYAAIERRDADAADRLASEHCDLFRRRLSRQVLASSPYSSELAIDPGTRNRSKPSASPRKAASGRSKSRQAV